MKTIPLTQGKVALVDDENYEWLNQWKWYAAKRRNNYYAVRRSGSLKIYMHRVIARVGEGKHIDHKNGSGLDNRSENLRVVSYTENNRGFKKLQENKSSRFRGVHWYKSRNKWRATLKTDGRVNYIGLFENEEDAARARDAFARKLGWPEEGMNFPFDNNNQVQ